MGDDEAAIIRLWREKRGQVEPENLSGNLIVQLGLATEELNRRWYEANTGQVLTDIQRQIWHPALRWMAAALDGRVEATGAVFEAKFMLPWSFSEEAAAEKYMPQLQHNMFAVTARSAVLSVITGGGKWVEIATHADPLYSTSLSPLSESSGAASKAVRPLACSGSSRRSRALKPSASLI
jgi:predicted phage-related endonuclease